MLNSTSISFAKELEPDLASLSDDLFPSLSLAMVAPRWGCFLSRQSRCPWFWHFSLFRWTSREFLAFVVLDFCVAMSTDG